MAILTNMCMVYDNDGNVLVQNRQNKSWKGITFPGGHIEAKESFTDAVKREVFEETGLKINHPQLCGVKQWYEKDGTRYIVLCYKTNEFSGELSSSIEGEVSWVKLSDMTKLNLASGMEFMLQLFINENVSEHCFDVTDDNWINILK